MYLYCHLSYVSRNSLRLSGEIAPEKSIVVRELSMVGKRKTNLKRKNIFLIKENVETLLTVCRCANKPKAFVETEETTRPVTLFVTTHDDRVKSFFFFPFH